MRACYDLVLFSHPILPPNNDDWSGGEDGHVTFKNDKAEELSLDIARTPRLVKYGEELSKYGEKFS